MERRRRAVGWGWVLVCALLALPAGATAAPKTIAGFVGGGAAINTGGLFTATRDIAVFTGGDADTANDKIFVLEGLDANSRVQRLDGDGNFELLWGRDTVVLGAPGDTGSGFEVCSAALSGAENCKSAPFGSEQGELDDPRGIAVDQTTGAVYVMDYDNERVQQFTFDGGFVRAWGDAGTGAGQFGETELPQRAGIAVNPTAPHDVFVTDPANRRVLQFTSDGDFVRGWGHGVADGSDAFQVCTVSCQPGNSTGSGSRFATSWPRDIAVDGNGIVYASDGTADGRVMRFDSGLAGTPAAALLEPLPSPDLLAAGTTVGLEVDPVTGNLLVARDPASGPTVVQEVADPHGELAGSPPPAVVDTHVFADESVQGMGYDPGNGNVYLATPFLFAPPNGAFTFDGECPLGDAGFGLCAGLTVLAASGTPAIHSVGSADVSTTTAELTGSIDVEGGIGKFRFEVSRDGVDWRTVGSGYRAGAGTRSVTASATGLEPATLYRLRLAVSKQSGVSTFDLVSSPELTFLTDAAPPDVRTLGSANRTARGVRLRGTVDPNGSDTVYRFEWGPAGGSFDNRVPIPDASAGASNSPRPVVSDITGLLPDTEYQYRIVASNFVGESVGETVRFTTRVEGPASAPPAGRGYELVSPADKVSGVGVGFWYSGPGAAGFAGEAAHVGERFAARGQLGSVLTDGKFSWANDWALAERTPRGWVHAPIATRRAHGTQYKAFLDMSAATPDLSLMSWTSNGHSITIFEEMEGWDDDQLRNILLLRDWPGRWEAFVGLTDPRENRASADGPVDIAADGSAVVAQGSELGDETDPSGDVVGSSVYVNDVSAGLSDTFPGAGMRTPVNVCSVGTTIPAVLDVGGEPKLSEQGCPLPAPGRFARIVGDRGASFQSRPGGISDDGERVFFTSGDAATCTGSGSATSCPAQLYVRQRNRGGEPMTRWISKTEVSDEAGASEDQDASLMAPVVFEGASADGDKAFFRTTAPLTADDPNGQGAAPPPGGVVSGASQSVSWDLYMYDLGPGGDPAVGGNLTRISAGPTGTGDCNSGGPAAGAARLISRDGARVYFVCAAPLPGVGVPGSGTITDPAGTRTSVDFSNLYLYDANQTGADRWRFVARLPRESELGSCATTATGKGPQLAPISADDPLVQIMDQNNCFHATPDGGFTTFWTDGRLTDDDPDAASGDVYGYDAIRDELVRLSAPRGGVGGTYRCAPGGASPALCYGDGGIGAPGAAPLERLGVAVGSDGVPLAFFQSRSRLLPADTDSAYDVYQWRAGELTLITPGASETDGAFFVGNDRAGVNVYIATRDRLTWQDHDAVLDVYTARVGGGFPEPPPPPSCGVLADLCQGPGVEPTVPVAPESDRPPREGDAPPGERVSLRLANVSRAELRRAARTGVVTVRLRASGPVTARVVARARVGGRLRRVGAGGGAAEAAGVLRVRVPLTKLAKRRLRGGRRLTVRLTATAKGARPAVRSLTLKGGRR